MSTPAETKKEVNTPKLVSNRIKPAEFARNKHRATPEQSASLRDILNPAYWAHTAAKFAVGDLIEVFPEGGAWYAQLLVVGCSKLHAKVAVLSMTKLANEGGKSSEDKAAFTVEFKGPQRKWSVIRVADKAYVKEGFDSKEEAAKWLANNEAELLNLA